MKRWFMIGLSCICFSAYAADQVIKEETTPPASEGAITTDQIPPLYLSGTQTPAPPAVQQQQQPQQQVTQPAAPQQNAAPAQPSQPAAPQQPTMQTAPQNPAPPQTQ